MNVKELCDLCGQLHEIRNEYAMQRRTYDELAGKAEDREKEMYMELSAVYGVKLGNLDASIRALEETEVFR